MIDPMLTGLAGAACCAVGIRGVILIRTPSAAERRELSGAVERRSRRGPTRRVVDLLGSRLGPRVLRGMSDKRRVAVTRRLDLAGRPGGLNLERYAELKAATFAIGAGLAVLFLLFGSWFAAVVCLAIGLVAVDSWLSRTGRHRQDRLERDLPDFVDVIAISVRAGTGYRAALERVSDSLSGPPADEIRTTLRQMDLGATRREAFEALRGRNDSGTLDNFVGAQLQAEELGVPLADALASIASDTRRSAAQAARRRAQRATPRVSLISAVTMLPATMLLIAGGLFIGSGLTGLHLFGG